MKRFLALGSTVLLLASTLVADAAEVPEVPRNPLGIGGIVAWVVCARRKREAIGGWLMYYYWVLYGGVIYTAVLLAFGIQNYVPQNFVKSSAFVLLMCSVVPGLVLLVAQASVATFLLLVRKPDMLKLLRSVMVVNIGGSLLGVIISASYFPENLVFHVPGLGSGIFWLAYFFMSRRVKHVFVLGDWDIAVDSIHPRAGAIKVVP